MMAGVQESKVLGRPLNSFKCFSVLEAKVDDFFLAIYGSKKLTNYARNQNLTNH